MKRLQVYHSSGITVTFDPNVCVHSGVCLQALPRVFDVRRSRWIDIDAAAADEIAAAIDRCPSGALQYYRHVESDPSAKYRLTKAVLVNRVGVTGSEHGAREERAKAIAGAIREARPYDWVGVYDVAVDEIAVVAWAGDHNPSHPRFPRTRGLNGAAVAERKTVVVNDVSADARYLETQGSTRAEMVVPVFEPRAQDVVGTIDVASDQVDAFAEQDVELVEACAAAASRLWEHGRANHS
jgi:putative methionine-R-sulfoxide reductase with GAF domain